MIELLREASAIFLCWAIGLTITYGFVESRFPITMALRIAIASSRRPPEGAERWWGEELFYCPKCLGFWIQGFCGLALEPTWMGFVRGAALGTVALLLVRAFGDVELVGSAWDAESGAIAKMREQKGSS